jgi:hypothetical protein
MCDYNDKQFLKLINCIVINNKDSYSIIIKSKFPEFHTLIKSLDGKSFSQKLYNYINNITIPKCTVCGENDDRFGSYITGYITNHCSVKCSRNNNEIKDKWYQSRYTNKTDEELDEINLKNKETNYKTSITKQNIINDKGLNLLQLEYIKGKGKRKETRIKHGFQLPDELVDDYILYKRMVWFYTRRQNLKSLIDYDKRGRLTYHLDHKYSIMEGFIRNIPPYIIGNINNLEMLPYDDNIRKHKGCSITEYQLFDLVYP